MPADVRCFFLFFRSPFRVSGCSSVYILLLLLLAVRASLKPILPKSVHFAARRQWTYSPEGVCRFHLIVFPNRRRNVQIETILADKNIELRIGFHSLCFSQCRSRSFVLLLLFDCSEMIKTKAHVYCYFYHSLSLSLSLSFVLICARLCCCFLWFLRSLSL